MVKNLKILQWMLLGLAAGYFSATISKAKEHSNIEASGPSGPLKGVMTEPEKSSGAPVVLIIPGSGPTDRDGNGPYVKASTYKLLAMALTKRGIATVRVDKRGMFASAAAISDANKVTMEAYAGDIHRWVAVIKKHTKLDCVWILGHSEGGLVALLAGQKPEHICGLILASSPGRRLSDVMREQVKMFSKTKQVLDQALVAIDRLEAGKRVDITHMHPALKPLFRADVQGFMINLFAVDPAYLIAGFKKPVLILQGKRDLQIGEADAHALQKANADAELVLLADVNHVFKTITSEDRTANLMTYANPHLPLAPHVAEAIAKFILKK